MIGGLFLKAEDPKFLARWYEDHLGIGFGTNVYFSFKWRDSKKIEAINNTVFSFFKNDSGYFLPSVSKIMFNIRVENLDSIRLKLKEGKHFVDEKVESYDYGRFGWTMDTLGNKIELWEAIDGGFEDNNSTMELFGKVTGLQGITVFCAEPSKAIQFYSEIFEMEFDENSYWMKWNSVENKLESNKTKLSFVNFGDDNSANSTSGFKIGFYVNRLTELLHDLKSSEIKVSHEIVETPEGKFGWAMDPYGNKIEFFERN